MQAVRKEELNARMQQAVDAVRSGTPMHAALSAAFADLQLKPDIEAASRADLERQVEAFAANGHRLVPQRKGGRYG